MRKRRTMRSAGSKRNGFTMIDALLALLVLCVCVSVGAAYMQTASRVVANHQDIQREFMVLQLRQFLASASSIEVAPDRLEAVVRHELFTIEQDKNRLVKRGGYEILDENVDRVMFYEEGERIYVQMDEETYQIY